jgi:hypothetical protein
MSETLRQKHFELENYSVSFIPSKEHLSACSLEVGDGLRLLCRLRVEEHLSSQATIELEIKSQTKELANENALYTNRIKRLLQNCIILEQYEKSKFVFTLDILDKKINFDIYHHLINVLVFCLLDAKIEVKYLLVASSCFLDDKTQIIDEVQARHLLGASNSLKQIFLCKRLDNDDEVLSFKVNGNLGRDQELGSVFSFLIAASNKMGREMLKYVLQKQ